MASASSVNIVDAVQHSDSVAEHSDSVAKHIPVDDDDDKYYPVFVFLPCGNNKVLEVLPDFTVYQLKLSIYKQIGVPPAYADLWYGNTYLYDDNATMEQLGVEAQSEILIALRVHRPPVPYGLSFRYRIGINCHSYVSSSDASPPNDRHQLAFLEEFEKIGGNKGHRKGGGKGSGKFELGNGYNRSVNENETLRFYPSY